MDKTVAIDTFKLCWSVILSESAQSNNTFFGDEHCKILDSRDIDFSKVENRLAYVYKFGSFNIEHFEKCILNFLDGYSEWKTILPLENLNICSLSNGPGLDIIGLLCAFCKSRVNLEGFPHLNAINLYDSWMNMYDIAVKKAYETVCLRSCFKYFHIPKENIHLAQSDIYNTMSPDTEKLISDCNVLLMVKAFVSTKAAPDTFKVTLQKIFSLLKPGSLIFFVGSKHNMKNFSKYNHLSNAVKCIFGPQKVTLDTLSPDEKIVNSINIKPLTSGHATFCVWQKREQIAVEEITVKKKRTRSKKKKALKNKENQQDNFLSMDNQDSALNMEKHASNELLEDSDVESDISFASCSRQSDSLSDELKSESLTNSSGELNDQTSQEVAQDLPESSISDSISCFTPVLHKMEEKESNIGKLSSLLQNMHQSINKNEFNDTESSNQMKEPESVTSPSKTKLQTTKQEIKNLETTRGEIVENLTPFASGLYQTVFPPFIQNKVSAKGKESKVNKIFDKNKILSTQVLSNELYIENNNKSKISLKENDASSAQSCKNNFKLAGNEMNVQGDRISQDIQRLVQRLDSLVSALEIMTADMKRDISLKNDKGLTKCVCSKEPYCEFRVPCCSCSARTISSHICRKICNTIKYNCRACTNVHPCQSNIKVAHNCCCVCKA